MRKRDDDSTSSMLEKFLSPADAQSLVKPPPDQPPHSGPGVSTPLTGNLTAPPSQSRPSRQGLAGYFDGQGGDSTSSSDASSAAAGDAAFIKVSSNGQVGYLPRANLTRALAIDPQLKVLGE